MGISRTFRVYNQPLFAYPDTGDMSYPIIFGILNDQDIMTHMQRAMITNMNMGHLRKFNRQLSDGTYSPGYPITGTTINVNVTSSIQNIVQSYFADPIEIDYVHAGYLTDLDWITYCLSTDYGSQIDFRYVSSSEDACPQTHEVVIRIGTEDIVGVIIDASFNWNNVDATVSITYLGEGSGIEETIELPVSVPSKPDGQHWVAGVRNCVNTGGEGVSSGFFKVWKVADGTHGLELPSFSFGSEGETPECFPAVPVRIKNVDYNEETFPEDETEIKNLLKIFGIRPYQIIDGIFSDEAVDETNLDNVFSNFGVRVWDESEAGRQYLYTFFSTVLEYLVAAGATDNEEECLETFVNDDHECEPDLGCTSYYASVPSCSTITINTEYSKHKLFFSTIRNVFYTLAEINADPSLSAIYYSDNGLFHSSSGELLRPAGYTAMTSGDVDAWAEGGGVRSNRQITEGDAGWDHLKPAVRITSWTGVIYDADGNVSTDDELIPETVYERYSGGAKKIAPEPTTDIREITYYAILPTGMDAITVYGIGGQVLVEDTEFPDESALVPLRSNVTNQLTVPFMFGIVENIYDDGQLHDKVDALVASMHVSVYVADVTITRVPFWVRLVQVITFVIAVVMFYFNPPLGLAVAETSAALYVGAALYVVSAAIFEILSELNEWFAIVLSVALAAVGAYQAGAFSVASLSRMSLMQILDTAMKLVMSGFKVFDKVISDENKDEFTLLEGSYIEEINELRLLQGSDDYGKYGDITIDALYGEPEKTQTLAPIDPQRYFDRVDNFHNVGFSLMDYDSMFDDNIILPGMGTA